MLILPYLQGKIKGVVKYVNGIFQQIQQFQQVVNMNGILTTKQLQNENLFDWFQKSCFNTFQQVFNNFGISDSGLCTERKRWNSKMVCWKLRGGFQQKIGKCKCYKTVKISQQGWFCKKFTKLRKNCSFHRLSTICTFNVENFCGLFVAMGSREMQFKIINQIVFQQFPHSSFNRLLINFGVFG